MPLLRTAAPPMGWNSWDCYGTTVTEAEVLANAEFLAEHLLPFGWDTVVVGGSVKKRCCGRKVVPSPSRVAVSRASSADQFAPTLG